ncbi:MAG: hypothetical protein R3C09_06225 [Pirellulaceae bacterium]
MRTKTTLLQPVDAAYRTPKPTKSAKAAAQREPLTTTGNLASNAVAIATAMVLNSSVRSLTPYPNLDGIVRMVACNGHPRQRQAKDEGADRCPKGDLPQKRRRTTLIGICPFVKRWDIPTCENADRDKQREDRQAC